MSCIEKTWAIALALLAVSIAACAGKDQLVGSDGSSVGGPSSAETGDTLTYTFMGPLNLGGGKCLPDPIPAETSCKLLTTRSGAACDCSEPGLTRATSGVNDALRKQLQLVGHCGSDGQPPCTDDCACEVSRALGTSLIECKTLPEPSSDSSGWCYVSAAAGEPQTGLVSDCPSNQQQTLRFMGNPDLLSGMPSFLACVEGGGATPLRTLGEVCSVEVGDSLSNFTGTSVIEVAINDHSPMCGSGFCVTNHFQGLVSCPYGQAAGAGDCFVAGNNVAISGVVKPQLVERQAAIASICSCQCDGQGPGPYCTCPESMQCEHLVDDIPSSTLGGSYCIPKGSAWDFRGPRTECVEPNCGVKHPY